MDQHHREAISAGRKKAYAEGRIRSNRKILQVPSVDVTIAWGNWFAGLVDGEGCFFVAKTTRVHGVLLQPQFLLTLRADDEGLLKEVQACLNIGTVRRENKTDKNPTSRFGVYAIAHCMALVNFFDRFQLRSKKELDFTRWSPIVRLCMTVESPRYDEHRELVDALTEGRRFQVMETT